jgi:beta-glucanase (GH16 family)
MNGGSLRFRQTKGSHVRPLTARRQASGASVGAALVLWLGACVGSGEPDTGGPPGAALTGPEAGPSKDATTKDDAPAYVDTPFDAGPTIEECTALHPPPTGQGEELVFSDDFDGDTIDESKWNIREGYIGHGAIENTAARENLAVRNGSLFVTVKRDPSNPVHPYSSGQMDTDGRFSHTFGRTELRARFPYAPGAWYALWSVPWSDKLFPEIDIEVLSKKNGQVWFVNHWDTKPLPADERRMYATIDGEDITAFHLYEVEWTPGKVTWSFDGKVYMTSTDKGVPKEPMIWVINGWVGGWGGPPTPESPFPTTFEVDYVRVYMQNGLRGNAAMRINNARAKYSQKTEQVRISLADFNPACAQVRMFDGEREAFRISTPPFHMPMNRVAKGRHKLRFVASDGVHEATTELDAEVQ